MGLTGQNQGYSKKYYPLLETGEITSCTQFSPIAKLAIKLVYFPNWPFVSFWELRVFWYDGVLKLNEHKYIVSNVFQIRTQQFDHKFQNIQYILKYFQCYLHLCYSKPSPRLIHVDKWSFHKLMEMFRQKLHDFSRFLYKSSNFFGVPYREGRF